MCLPNMLFSINLGFGKKLWREAPSRRSVGSNASPLLC